MILTIVTRERQFSAEFAQIITCIYTDDKHMNLIYIDDKQTSLDISN